MVEAALRRLRLYGGLLMFGHSVFSLPFALAAMLYASGGRPGWRTFLLVTLAFLGARNAANALNRFIDRKIDAENPRTSGRQIPAGAVRPFEALLLAGFFGLMLLVSAWFLPPLCIRLLPVAAILMLLYSFTKRFTWLCHLVLGVTSAAASVGGWIAVTGEIQWPCLALAASNAAWVTGFDLIYQCLDTEHDRKAGLHSVSADFGVGAAMALSALCHAAAVGFLAVFGALAARGAAFWIGLAFLAVLLTLEQAAARRKGPAEARPRRILFSAYTMNQIVGPAFLAVSLADLYLTGRPS
jgi:4-hydroxybenzoate polyprenyltransferase